MRRTLLAVSLAALLTWPALGSGLWDNGAPLTRVVSQHYHADPVAVISVGQDTHDPMDVLVTFELARLSQTPPLVIHKMRLSGAHWTAIMAQRGISAGTLRSGVSPLPHALDHQGELYDNDVRELVGLRVVSSTTGMSVADVVAQRNNGVSYVQMLTSR
jgi:hypothetical protein